MADLPRNQRRNPNYPAIADPGGDPRLDEGIRLYNAGEHWHAHEEWEGLWLGLEGPDKLFVQGLIMSAACLVQVKRGIAVGVANHLANAESRLQPHAPQKWGIDVAGLLAQVRAAAAGELAPAAVCLLRRPGKN